MVEINWTRLALADLRNIFEFIKEDSHRYAQITVARIQSQINLLVTQPKLGSIVPEYNDAKIRQLHSGRYRIIYEIISFSRIDVLRIYHSARLLKSGE